MAGEIGLLSRGIRMLPGGTVLNVGGRIMRIPLLERECLLRIPGLRQRKIWVS